MELFVALLFIAVGGLLPSATAQWPCDTSWVLYENACYKKFTSSLTWAHAEATCVSFDSHLPSIQSSEENDFLFTFMGIPINPHAGGAYWLAGSDIMKKGVFMNVDGTKWTYVAFGSGQPDNMNGNERAVGSWILENGHMTWNDYPLTYTFPFACKYYLGNRMCKRDDLWFNS